eukprot:10504853-Lingulodinium_polyedra.AAC.1
MPARPLEAYLEGIAGPEPQEESQAKRRKQQKDLVWESLIVQHPWLKEYEEKVQGFSGAAEAGEAGAA